MILNKMIYNVDTGKPVEINIDKIIKGRALFQANSGGGKSYLLRKFLEESFDKVQHIIIDPEGEFATLREEHNYLLVGKDNADIQIDIRHAELLAKKLMETGTNAILDLYEMSTFERMRFVKIFCEALVNLPKKLWHPCIVIIDEIHVFAPESSKGRSESLEAVAGLASRGRKRGYALVGATQKLSKFHKDVAAELNTKFTGRCTLDIDQKRAAQELGIKNHTSLRNLDNEFFVFGPGIEGTIKVKAYKVKTTHEDIGTSASIKLANPSKIKSMLKDFEELPQEAEIDVKTKQGLQLKLQELQTKLREAQKNQTVIKQDVGELNKTWKKGYDECLANIKPIIADYKARILKLENTLRWKAKRLSTTSTILNTLHENTEELLEQIKDVLDDKKEIKMPLSDKGKTEYHTPDHQESKPIEPLLTHATVSSHSKKAGPTLVLPGPGVSSTKSTPIEIEAAGFDEGFKLGRCEEACLKAIAQRGKETSKVQVAVIAGYSPTSGSFSNAISKLRTCLLIEGNGAFTITQAGTLYLGEYERLSEDPVEVLSFWIQKAGKCPGAILKFVCESHPSWVTKSQTAEITGYSVTSGSFSNGISKLHSLGLIERGHDGMIRATDEMMLY